MKVARRLLCCLGLLATLALPVQSARQGKDDREKSFPETVGEIAKKIVKLCEDEKHTSVAVTGFNDASPTALSAAGPKIQAAMIDALKKRNIDNNKAAAFIVSGEYSVIKDEKDPERLTLQLDVRVKRSGGKTIEEYGALLGYGANEDLIKIMAINADYGENYNNPNKEELNKKLKQEYEKPTPPFTPPMTYENQVKKDALFGVEVLAGPSGEACHPREAKPNKDGHLFVDVKDGEVYRLKLINHTDIEACATITIDGVDAFQFYEPAKGKPTSFLIPKKGSRLVKGWKRSTKHSNEFLVGKYEDSAAYQTLRSSASVGTITVCFHHCWESDKVPPEYTGSRATQLGKEIEDPSKVVPRTIGPMREAISIRYKK